MFILSSPVAKIFDVLLSIYSHVMKEAQSYEIKKKNTKIRPLVAVIQRIIYNVWSTETDFSDAMQDPVFSALPKLCSNSTPWRGNFFSHHHVYLHC